MDGKKSFRGKTGIALLVAGVIAISGVGASLAGTAYAADATAAAGEVVINPATDSTTTEYNAYQIFKADIGTDDTATDLAWSNDAIKTAVVTFLGQQTPQRAKTYDAWIAESGYMRGTSVSADDRNDPSNALGYINSEWNQTGNLVDGTDPAHPAGGGFPQELAKVVAATSGAVKDTVAASTAWTGHKANADAAAEEGWYLFTTKTAGTEELFTNAIFVPVGGAAHTITEKAAPVTFTKQIKDDGDWGTVGDAEVGSKVSYKLTFTLPDNYAEYASYALNFADVPASGISIDTSTVAVKYDGTALATTAYSTDGTSASALAVAISNMKTAVPTAVAGKTVTVEYDATVTVNAVEAPLANPNTATVTFSNDPLSDGTGTKESKAKVYDYAITVHKTGENNMNLKGAKFKIAQGTTEGNTYFNSTSNTWTNAVGSATEFETDADGVFSVSGLDANTTYYLVETVAPHQYAQLTAPVTITLTPTYNSDGVLTALSATPSGNNATVEVTDIVIPQSGDPTGGVVTLTIPNEKEPVTFALTGGLGPAIIVGAIVVVGGVALFITSRKKRDEEAEE